MSVHTAGTACLALKAGDAVYETQCFARLGGDLQRLLQISEKWQAYFLEQKPPVSPAKAGFGVGFSQ